MIIIIFFFIVVIIIARLEMVIIQGKTSMQQQTCSKTCKSQVIYPYFYILSLVSRWIKLRSKAAIY